ncbi:MAG: TonB-dependent receptor [Caulobacteraceae bacterium]|nr:TonB-dependent receptor [Caulobacteraceae bacterium]
MGASAWAEDTVGARPTLEEIVVTANKRTERLSEVAAAVSAVQGEDLTKRNLLQIQDFAAQVPGMTFQPVGAFGTRIILRGLDSGGAGATVATVIDETPLSYSTSTAIGAVTVADIDTYDMERIEVLRGPQGTLYGATAEGGLIKYVTKAPRLDRFNAGVQVEAESVDQGGVGGTGRGYLNLPLVDNRLALRLTGFYKNIEGYIDNPLIGQKDINGGRRYGGRAQLLFQASDALSFRLTAFTQEQHVGDTSTVQVVGANTHPSTPSANQYDFIDGSGHLVHNSYLASPIDSQDTYYSLVTNYNAGFADVISATSYGEVNHNVSLDDSDSNLAPGYTYSNAVSPAYGQLTDVVEAQRNNLKKFNQEIRLSSKPGSSLFGMKLDWQGGLFYTHEDILFDQFYIPIANATKKDLSSVYPIGGSNLPSTYDEGSVFGQVTAHLTQKFDVALGGRYSENHQWSQVYNHAGLAYGATDVLHPAIKTSEDKFTYSVTPRYHFTDDAMAYVTVASGYRPGGPVLAISGAPADLPTTYKPDNTVNYEIGFKGDFLERKVSVDVAAFYIDWSDVQIDSLVTSVTTHTTFTVTGNAGAAVSKGFEWTLSYAPIRGLSISDIGSYVDAHLTVDALALGGHSGDRLAYVPDWSNTLNVDYEWTLMDHYRAFVGGSWNFVGKRYSGFTASTAVGDHVALPSYNVFNGQVGVTFDKYTVEFFAHNIANGRGLTNYSTGGGHAQTGTASIIQPRTVGVRLSADF